MIHSWAGDVLQYVENVYVSCFHIHTHTGWVSVSVSSGAWKYLPPIC